MPGEATPTIEMFKLTVVSVEKYVLKKFELNWTTLTML